MAEHDEQRRPEQGAWPRKQEPTDDNGVRANASAALAVASWSSGVALPAKLQRKFGSSLGADLSDVRVHDGPESQAAASAVGAKAYTHGNDIHFGAGQYNPSSPEGEHLLAHEVAHTVQQQGGIKRLQLKDIAVSTPNDSHEVEADRAADAMVAGKTASIDAAPVGIHRKAGDVSMDVTSGDASISVGKQEVEWPAGPLVLTPAVSGSIKFKNKNGKAAAGDSGGPSVSVSKDSVTLSAQKELGPASWTIKPTLSSDVKVDKNGVTLGVGVTVSHKGFSLGNLHAGPFSIEGKIVDWEAGKTPKFLCIEPSAKLSADVPGTYLGYQVTPSLTVSVGITPNWVEIGKALAEALVAAADTMAFALLAPLATGVTLAVGWAKAGHEFDDVHRQIESLHARTQALATEVMTGKHIALGMVGIKDINASMATDAAAIRKAIAAQIGVPEGAFADATKAKPNLPNLVYQAAWKKLWFGDLKPKLAEVYKDKPLFEKLWLDSFDTGDFSKG